VAREDAPLPDPEAAGPRITDCRVAFPPLQGADSVVKEAGMLEFIRQSMTLIAFGLASPFGVNAGIEESKYQVVQKLGDGIEIREYESRIVAETTIASTGTDMARSEGFDVIARYIFGANQKKQSIAMTAPVEMAQVGTTIAMNMPVEAQNGSDAMAMRFFMPASYRMESLPTPTDSRVKLVEVPRARQAVMHFTGSTSDAAIAGKARQLLEALKTSSWNAVGPTSAYLYNPPWTLPFLRRNEVMVAVAAR